VVKDQNYLWKISSKRPYVSEFDYSPMYIAIQLDSDKGSKLIVNTNMAPPLNYAFGDDPRSEFRAITPSDIKNIILKALDCGWQPIKEGKPFELEVNMKTEIKK
jgi:hypothetical protein